MKVHELGKEINQKSKDIIINADKLGVELKGPNSNVPEEKVEEIKNSFISVTKAEKPVTEKKADNKNVKQAAPKETPVVPTAVAARAPKETPVVPASVAARAPKETPVVPPAIAARAAKEAEGKKVSNEKSSEEVLKMTEDKTTEKKPVEKPKETGETVVRKEKTKEVLETGKESLEKKTEEKKPASSGIRIVSTAEGRAKEEERRRAAKALEAREKPAPRGTREEPKKRINNRDGERNNRPNAGSKSGGGSRYNNDNRPTGGNRPTGDNRKPYDGERKSFDRNNSRPDSARPSRPSRPESGSGQIEVEKPLRKTGKEYNKDFKKKDTSKDKDKLNRGVKPSKDKKYNKLSYEDGDLEKKTKGKKQQKVIKENIEPEVVVTEDMPVGTRIVNVPITVAGFCEQLAVTSSQVILTLLKMGVVSNINATLDEDTVQLLAEEMKLSIIIGKVEEVEEDEGLEIFDDKEDQLKDRAPIITVMGHVDHGKTSLLDAIRKTNVTSQESGGITQHIGASEVDVNGKKIVFLDTPGHEAFTAMRARGANITDIAILVVAADDSVKPQTIESISHAKAAGVPIIVAINKMDKPGANPDMVKQDLSSHGIVVEEWGGDVIAVPVSAKSGDGIVNLLEMILLQAEVLELKANPDRFALGTVIEARLDKAKGPIATLLVTNGTLKAGQSIVAGTTSGKIRLMTNFKGDTIRKAGPATAVEILGLTDVPAAGDNFNSVKDDRLAKEIAEKRKGKQREEVLARNSSTTLEELFNTIQEGETKDLNLIIKGDVRGSVGAVVSSLEKLNTENVRVKIIHSGVGAVTESDVTLAGTSGAIIIGFNVRPSVAVTTLADRENVQIKTYRVIYDIIDDITNAIKGMLDPEFKEVVLGTVEVRDIFKVPGAGIIAGAYVTSGKVVRNAEVRLVRDGIVIHEGKISSLRRFKDDAKEVAQGFECGIGIENYNDIKEGDIIECFQMEEIPRD